jgi:hypothetical protein
MTTTQSVVDILVGEGGYRELLQPMKIGSGSFQFAHALVAGDKANDLVIVIELKSETSDDTVVRNVLGLTRALDVLRSRRSVTAVLTSGQAAPDTIRSISRVCRVLPIGAPRGPGATEAVRDWLAALLPLRNPAAAEISIDWESDLRRRLPSETVGSYVERLIEEAPLGAEAIEAAFADEIRSSARPALEEDEE